ncbi:PPC domain-containing protein [Leptothoe sp. PORK10 BA2]|uniref:PPC domain-containing protein n=1 Tax=Leptothoe sp. PORK10 BA2 TaxID=3110254 RepID=UPI002B1F0F42|nr:PPC domain-containing protein [Leptothoe sp. PORK10 BA2]MEA5462496.1 PPC domain-containing protein [Leptothoe sp. PORK10 BA2]
MLSLRGLKGRQVNHQRRGLFGLSQGFARHGAWGMALALWAAVAPAATAQQAILDQQVEFQPTQDTYTFTAEAGQAVIIEMVSEEFDTFITLLNPAGEILDQNDDYNGTPQATIVLELPEAGEYTVLAGSFYGQMGGNYRVSVKPATDFQLVYDRALELMQSEDYGEAAEAYEAATALVPNDPNSYLGRADALLRHQALLLGESFGGPNDLPPEVREDIVENYEKAAQFYRANGNEDFAALILEQAEFIRTGEDPGQVN